MIIKGFARGVAAIVAIALVSVASAAEYTLKVVDKPAPKEISDSIRPTLQPKAVQLLNGDAPALELWLRTEVPLKSKPASPNDALGAVAETAVMGAMVVSSGDFRDYKDNEVPKGTYTVRFGLQPQDGDHLGTAEFNYFFILVPADTDKDLNGLNQFKPLTKASGKLTSSGHPSILSLRPASVEAAPKLTEPAAEHKAIRLKVHGKAGGGDQADVGFDFVYKGTGHIQ